MLPILLGGVIFCRLIFLTSNWLRIAKAGAISLLITLIFSLIPLLGFLIAHVPGIAFFVQGAVVFHLLSNRVLREVLNVHGVKTNLLPGIWRLSEL